MVIALNAGGCDLDLAIVGGGPAGISTALHLHAAAPHLKVAVLEKARYPRDKICAGGVGARALRILERLAVEVDCPCVAIDAVGLRICGETIVTRVVGCAAVVRRVEFDHALARVAVDRGIAVREECEVVDLAIDDAGVTLVLGNGERVRARAIVGADGVAGAVRRLAGFSRGVLRAQVVELDTPSAAHDLPRDTVVFDFETRELRGYGWDFPTVVAGEPLVCRGIYLLHDDRAAAGAGEAKARIGEYLAKRGLAVADYRLKQFAEQGFDPRAIIARPRVLLVGEAAGIDIASGEGIGQAIEYGAVAGPYLARALARDDLGFGDWRAAIDHHHLGFQMAIRHACYRAFYGRRRDRLSRMLLRVPTLLTIGVEDFAGIPHSPLAIARGIGQLALAARATR